MLLDDDRAVGHGALAVFDGDPVEQRRRVPDSDVGMDAVARSNLRIVLLVLFLVAEVIHEGSEMNEEVGIGGGRQRRAWIILRGSCEAAGTAAVAACTKKHRESDEA